MIGFSKIIFFFFTLIVIFNQSSSVITGYTPLKNGTTQGPTSTTVSSPSPTTAEPHDWIYYVSDNTKVCALVKFDASFIISDPSHSMKGEIPKDMVVDGHCGLDVISMRLDFFNTSNIVFHFDKLTSHSYFVAEVHIHFNLANFPLPEPSSITGEADLKNLTDYNNNFGHSYICNSGFNLFGLNKKWKQKITFSFKNFQVEAFRNDTTKVFSKDQVRTCLDNTVKNNLIPIIVGSVLIILIVIVLISYILSRRMRRTGYESV